MKEEEVEKLDNEKDKNGEKDNNKKEEESEEATLELVKDKRKSRFHISEKYKC